MATAWRRSSREPAPVEIRTSAYSISPRAPKWPASTRTISRSAAVCSWRAETWTATGWPTSLRGKDPAVIRTFARSAWPAAVQSRSRASTPMLRRLQEACMSPLATSTATASPTSSPARDSGGTPHVRAFSLAGGGVTEVASFLAYDPGFTGGVFVARGDVNGDGIAEIVTGTYQGGGPVRVFDVGPLGVSELTSFFAYFSEFHGSCASRRGGCERRRSGRHHHGGRPGRRSPRAGVQPRWRRSVGTRQLLRVRSRVLRRGQLSRSSGVRRRLRNRCGRDR